MTQNPTADTLRLTVREAIPSDASAWVGMRAGLWPVSSREEHALEVAEYFRGESDSAVVLVCARPDASLCGFLELSLRSHAEGCAPGAVPYVEGWYVTEEARGSGAGRALMRAAEEWARAQGHTEMASDAELENVASHQAHRALGFEEVERAVHFRKPL
jgi:aminoglycoside 6'-N-acetyltransferase I